MFCNSRREIVANYSLNEEDKFTLLAAAWFHDTGHLFPDAEHHEKRSVSAMRDYLLEKGRQKNIEILHAVLGKINHI